MICLNDAIFGYGYVIVYRSSQDKCNRHWHLEEWQDVEQYRLSRGWAGRGIGGKVVSEKLPFVGPTEYVWRKG